MLRVACVICVAGVLLQPYASARADAPTPTNQEKAKAHYVLGVDYYDKGDYANAIAEFQIAHELSQAPALYFNMAACEEHLAHFSNAAVHLRKYLDENPGAEDRATIEARIQSLEERVPPEKVDTPPPPSLAPTPLPVPATAPPTDRIALRSLHATWAMVGVTGALGITALALGSYTVVHHGDLKSSCGQLPTGCSSSQISGLKHVANAADAFIGLTIAAAVATAIVAVVEVKRAHQRGLAFTGSGIVF